MYAMRNNVISKYSFLLIAFIFLVGSEKCMAEGNSLFSAVQSISDGFGDAVKKRYGSINDLAIMKSGLHGIFNDQNADSEWPRVAITILSTSPNASEEPQHSVSYKDGGMTIGDAELHDSCIELTAVIWESPTESKSVDSFKYCTSDARRIDEVNLRSLSSITVMNWVNGQNECREFVFGGKKCNTGKSRTNGPMPPETRIPVGDKYFSAFTSTNKYFGITFDALLQAMGLDMDAMDAAHENRVWVVKLPKNI